MSASWVYQHRTSLTKSSNRNKRLDYFFCKSKEISSEISSPLLSESAERNFMKEFSGELLKFAIWLVSSDNILCNEGFRSKRKADYRENTELEEAG